MVHTSTWPSNNAARSIFWRLEPTDGIPPSLMLIYSWLHHVCTMIQGYLFTSTFISNQQIQDGAPYLALSCFIIYNSTFSGLWQIYLSSSYGLKTNKHHVWGHHLVSPFDRLSANLHPRLRSPPKVSPKVSPKPSPRPSEPSEQELESESSPVWRQHLFQQKKMQKTGCLQSGPPK